MPRHLKQNTDCPIMNRRRKPFYASETHNNTQFSVHTYFTDTQSNRNWSGLREFVDAPSSFGVDNTYKFLRKTNLDRLPLVTEPRITRKRFSLVVNLVTESQSPSKTPIMYQRTIESMQPFRKTEYMVRICIYDQISQIKNFWEYCVQIDLMKYLRNCFLKCRLGLQSLTVQQYREIQKYILLTFQHQKDKAKGPETPIALIGILELKTKQDLLRKLKVLHAQEKFKEIYQLVNHFMIPDHEVMELQLQDILQEVNRIYKFKKIMSTKDVRMLYLMDGSPVSHLYQMTTNNPIVIGAPKGITPSQLSALRNSLKLQVRMKEKVVRENMMKSVVKADRSSSRPTYSRTLDSKSYDRAERILSRRQRGPAKASTKDRMSLMRVKVPFFTKDELVRQYDIFQ